MAIRNGESAGELIRSASVQLLLVTCMLLHQMEFSGAAITATGPQCGTKVCQLDEFCSSHHKQCEGCASICDPETHNFDGVMCNDKCQDYLHDVRYLRQSAIATQFQQLQSQINLITVLLVLLLCIVVVAAAIEVGHYCRRRGLLTTILRKLKLKKASENGKIGKSAAAPAAVVIGQNDLTHANPHTQSPRVQLRNVPAHRNVHQNQINRESTVFSVDGASTIQTVSTPISNRHPAEDSTLSYSYDNAGLVVTPTIPDRPIRSDGIF